MSATPIRPNFPKARRPSPAASDNTYTWLPTTEFNGIAYQRSHVTMADIKDGTSNTYLAGEKYINPDYYATGEDLGDDWNAYIGMQNDVGRSCYYSNIRKRHCDVDAHARYAGQHE